MHFSGAITSVKWYDTKSIWKHDYDRKVL